MKSIRLMFEYQTTGTHIVSYSAFEVLLVNAREGAVEGEGVVAVGGWGSFIGGRGPCVCCCRRRTAAPPRPSRGGRTAPADTLRCCAFWAWRRRRPPARARGPGPPAGGSRGAPTAPPSGHAGTKRERISKVLGKKNVSRKHKEQNVREAAV